MRRSKSETGKWGARYLPTCLPGHLPALLAFTLYTLTFSSPAWGAYAYSRAITIDHTKCGSTNSNNFPMLFSGTYPYLATAANGGNIQNTSGSPAVPDDLIFTSDAAGSNLLSWEVEYYNASSGALDIWVKVPTLSSSANTVVYMWYGNAGVSTFQGGAPGAAWDSNFVAVYHFNASGGSTLTDSTSNSNNGSWSGNQTGTSGYYSSGLVGPWAGAFDASTDSITVAGMPSLSAFTATLWVTESSGSSGRIRIVAWHGNNLMLCDAGGHGAPQYYLQWYTAQGDWDQESTAALGSPWSQVVLSIDASGNLNAYINGANVGSQTGATVSLAGTGYIGSDQYGGSNWNGLIGEAHFSSTARSADWITAEYNNQSSPSSFYSIGSPAAPPASATGIGLSLVVPGP